MLGSLGQAIVAVEDMATYYRIWEAWAAQYERNAMSFVSFVQRHYPEVYAKAMAYRRVMGEL